MPQEYLFWYKYVQHDHLKNVIKENRFAGKDLYQPFHRKSKYFPELSTKISHKFTTFCYSYHYYGFLSCHFRFPIEVFQLIAQ